jgi:glycosyltransferase involved in cell wall biosynthesis
MTKGLIVADYPISAIASSSREWASNLDARILFASDFPSPKRLLKSINEANPPWVLFSWREALFDLVKLCGKSDQFRKFYKQSAVGLSIPDHLGFSNVVVAQNETLVIPSVDFVTVTSPKLQSLYKAKFPKTPIFPLFDMPNISAIADVVNEKTTKDIDVIWVGNSVWGKRQGMSDHKGYQSHVLPLVTILGAENPSTKVMIVDRSKSFLPHKDVLRLIARSRFLVQFSESEGTGLPLLEAMAMGTVPLTTDVGIASLALEEFSDDLVVENYLQAKRVIESDLDSRISGAMIDKYHQHVIRAEESVKQFRYRIEVELDSRKQRRVLMMVASLQARSFISLIWIYRYLRGKLKP